MANHTSHLTATLAIRGQKMRSLPLGWISTATPHSSKLLLHEAPWRPSAVTAKVGLSRYRGYWVPRPRYLFGGN